MTQGRNKRRKEVKKAMPGKYLKDFTDKLVFALLMTAVSITLVAGEIKSWRSLENLSPRELARSHNTGHSGQCERHQHPALAGSTFNWILLTGEI